MAEQNTISDEPSGIGGGGVDGIFKVTEDCPLQRVLAIREQGLVVESARAFEVGAAMVLGCHVDRRGVEGGGEFISAEVIVVESREMAAAKNRHQVTVLFSEISSEDREILLALPNADGIRLSRSQSRSSSRVTGTAQRAGLAIPPPEVFSTTQSAEALSATAKYSLMEMLADEGKAKPGSNEDADGSRVGQSDCSLN